MVFARIQHHNGHRRRYLVKLVYEHIDFGQISSAVSVRIEKSGIYAI